MPSRRAASLLLPPDCSRALTDGFGLVLGIEGGRQGVGLEIFEEVGGQIFGRDDVLAAAHKGVLQQVFQLAHVAGPGVVEKHLLDFRGNALDLSVEFAVEIAPEVLHQQGDVVPALLQRRHVDLDHFQTVVEIFAELSAGNPFLQITVGGGHQTHIDLDGRRLTDPLKFHVLDHPQQPQLHALGNFADLVQEDGAAVGPLESVRFYP